MEVDVQTTKKSVDEDTVILIDVREISELQESKIQYITQCLTSLLILSLWIQIKKLSLLDKT